MKATVKHVKGLLFIGTSESNYTVVIDGPKEVSGTDTAAHPMELVLIALGSCTGSDVISI
ncbi:MAG: hypothetical protein V1726_04435 [Methanobacteriota archaeon]